MILPGHVAGVVVARKPRASGDDPRAEDAIKNSGE